jgi:SnoaL-like protein
MPDLQDLLAKDAVLDTINRLFIGTDSRDWAMVRDALAPRLQVDMTSLAGGQPAEMAGADLAAAWETGLNPIQAVHHQTGNYRVTVLGDQAEAFCYGTATHYRPTRSGRNVRTFVGSYDFRLARLETKWRITSFRFNLKYVDGNLELEKD